MIGSTTVSTFTMRLASNLVTFASLATLSTILPVSAAPATIPQYVYDYGKKLLIGMITSILTMNSSFSLAAQSGPLPTK